MLEISIKRGDELTSAESEDLDEASRLAYAGDSGEDICWSDSQWFVLGKLDGRVVSLVGILQRTVLVGEQEVTIGGVGGVATHPQYQRKGYAGELMRRAGELMRDTLRLPFGMLFCAPGRIRFYSSSGWEEIKAPVYFTCRGERGRMHEHVMVLRIAGEPWPDGEVDLQGGPW